MAGFTIFLALFCGFADFPLYFNNIFTFVNCLFIDIFVALWYNFLIS